jgi:hypothetical protein
LTLGDTFMLEDEDGIDEHLHVIITNPSSTDEVITVSISTRRANSECLVCLHPGEHPFIVRESVCPYRFAKIRTCAGIAAALADGRARAKEPASKELVTKLAAGLLDSDFAPPGVRAYYLEVTPPQEKSK